MSNLTDKIKRIFFQAAVMSTLLYGNYTRILRAVLNKSWRKHPTNEQLYGNQPPITKTIQVRRTRHEGHCGRSKEKHIWIPSHGQAKAGRPARTFLQQVCTNRGCTLEGLAGAMDDRNGWRERVKEIRTRSERLYIYIYIYILYRVNDA